mmetsp:Transcript_13498/g.38350  ORF Transcript_13498/g.38350 Transcript_13498/m.38350 type:complete len:295 (-) Transcript_13498:1167-2051(-)
MRAIVLLMYLLYVFIIIAELSTANAVGRFLSAAGTQLCCVLGQAFIDLVHYGVEPIRLVDEHVVPGVGHREDLSVQLRGRWRIRHGVELFHCTEGSLLVDVEHPVLVPVDEGDRDCQALDSVLQRLPGPGKRLQDVSQGVLYNSGQQRRQCMSALHTAGGQHTENKTDEAFLKAPGFIAAANFRAASLQTPNKDNWCVWGPPESGSSSLTDGAVLDEWRVRRYMHWQLGTAGQDSAHLSAALLCKDMVLVLAEGIHLLIRQPLARVPESAANVSVHQVWTPRAQGAGDGARREP